jgi:ankyrin repeat protein
MRGRLDILDIMLREPLVNVEVQDAKTQATPFLHACSQHDIETVGLLLRHGARSDVCDRHARNGLHLCQRKKGGVQVATCLLDSRAVDVDSSDDFGYTALRLAAENANKIMVELLLDRGAKPNKAGPGGYTPLMAAVEASMPNREVKEGILTTLLQRGADPLLKYSGKTAAQLAKDRYIKNLLDTRTRNVKVGKSGKKAFDALQSVNGSVHNWFLSILSSPGLHRV